MSSNKRTNMAEGIVTLLLIGAALYAFIYVGNRIVAVESAETKITVEEDRESKRYSRKSLYGESKGYTGLYSNNNTYKAQQRGRTTGSEDAEYFGKVKKSFQEKPMLGLFTPTEFVIFIVLLCGVILIIAMVGDKHSGRVTKRR